MSMLCRTCGQEAERTRELFDKEGTDTLYDILKLTGIWLTDKLGVPTRICGSCLLDLKEAIAFRERCITTNKFWIEEQDKHQTLDTVEKNAKLEMLPRVSVPSTWKGDDVPSNKTEEAAYPLGTQKAFAAEVQDPLMSEETIKVENEPLQVEGESPPFATRKMRGRPPKMKNESVVKISPENKFDKEPTRRKWSRAKRVHTKEEGLYFCEQCGKSFSEKGNFNVHLTRHTGLKQFECEECGRKEFTLHLLKLHVRIKHRGELPYVCKYCGQRFDNCIKRLRHERGHKESPVHRPHTCDICKKAFKDKITLRFHAVVHTGEQPFHCELCQAHFNRKSSLRTHFRSKQHKKKAEEQEQQKPSDAVQADE